jgi:hypothetical protein
MHGGLASEWRAGELAATVRDHLVHVHIELRAAAGHPNVQRKHIVMLAGEDFIAGLNDQFVTLIVQSLAVMVGCSCRLLQNGIGANHLAWN